MSLKSFFKEAALQPENLKIAVSDRFKDEGGKPELWELRAISEKENAKIKDSCTVKTTIHGGRTKTTFDGDRYTKELVAASVVYPDLKDAELQKSYAVVGEVELLNLMLLPGEMTSLTEAANTVNGFELEKFAENKEAVKNS